MRNILLFNTFVTQDVLIIFYYMGAILMPIAIFLFRDEIIKRVTFLKRINDTHKKFYSTFKLSKKIVFWLVFITIFLCMELCWRMIFEMMIGYFDMHNYLYQISIERK